MRSEIVVARYRPLIRAQSKMAIGTSFPYNCGLQTGNMYRYSCLHCFQGFTSCCCHSRCPCALTVLRCSCRIFPLSFRWSTSSGSSTIKQKVSTAGTPSGGGSCTLHSILTFSPSVMRRSTRYRMHRCLPIECKSTLKEGSAASRCLYEVSQFTLQYSAKNGNMPCELLSTINLIFEAWFSQRIGHRFNTGSPYSISGYGIHPACRDGLVPARKACCPRCEAGPGRARGTVSAHSVSSSSTSAPWPATQIRNMSSLK